VDLNRSTDEIFAGFDYTRAVCPIKKAAKHGIVIKQAETDREKERYFEFYRSFAEHPKRKGKILVIQRHELDFLTVLYALSPEGDYLGGIGLLPSADGRYLLAKYSATLHRCCEQDLLVWHAIQYAKEHRYAWFDLSWMLPTEDTNSDQYRLYQYKKKFGGELVDFYAYVRFSALFAIPGKLFSLALAVLFGGDINRFSLFLKKIRMFR
jgi:lipid II:glycine glycyltransferase (peptidoglycan interpeptide bridge formation enzyme)